VFQSILPLHECADPTAAESAAIEFTAEPLHSVADSFAAEHLQFVAGCVAGESAVEPLKFVADSVANSAVVGATPTETS
jgi:hypothetical protein